MTLVLDRLQLLLPARAKKSPSGWISFNAPCCHHRGNSPDTRRRGGVKFSDGFVYNCFNCKYTASWSPGRQISEKLKSLLKWMNATDDEINKIIFEAMKTESPDYIAANPHPLTRFDEKELPKGSSSIDEWVRFLPADSPHQEKLAAVIQYVMNRGYDPLSPNFYWTPEPGFEDRVVIPFRYEGKIVGYTARRVTEGRPKYISDQYPHFVFNVDAQVREQKYLFVVEGPFDALSIGGVALLTNDIAEQQYRIIKNLGYEVIVIPDQDRPGLQLIEKAVEYDWAVAFPTWEDDVKDSADAVKRYGKLFVTVDAIQSAQRGAVRIELAKKKLETHLKNLELRKQQE